VSIDLKQISENAVECFGISNWNKQKIGALILIFQNEIPVPQVIVSPLESPDLEKKWSKKNSTKKRDIFQESTDIESTYSVDDIDEGSAAKRPLVPSFEAFKGKVQQIIPQKIMHRSPLTERYGPSKAIQMSPKPFLACSRPPCKTQWNNCITPCINTSNFNIPLTTKAINSRQNINPLLQTQVICGTKQRVLPCGPKPGAFKNLKFGDDSENCAIPRRARSGEKKKNMINTSNFNGNNSKEVEQNINFHFWLSPRDPQGCMMGRNLIGNSLNNRIKVVINKSSVGANHLNS